MCILFFCIFISVVFRDTPRKRGGPVAGSSGAARFSSSTGSSSAEPQLEEVVDENFPVGSLCLVACGLKLNLSTFFFLFISVALSLCSAFLAILFLHSLYAFFPFTATGDPKRT